MAFLPKSKATVKRGDVENEAVDPWHISNNKRFIMTWHPLQQWLKHGKFEVQ